MEKIPVIYWSGTGNTAMMAKAVAQGITEAGAEAEVFSVENFPVEDIDKYSKLAFGCPSMGDEILEESEFAPFFHAIEGKLSGKKVALFGSYGWGDGKWMKDWQDRVESKGAKVYKEGLIINGSPDADGKALCNNLGKGLVSF